MSKQEEEAVLPLDFDIPASSVPSSSDSSAVDEILLTICDEKYKIPVERELAEYHSKTIRDALESDVHASSVAMTYFDDSADSGYAYDVVVEVVMYLAICGKKAPPVIVGPLASKVLSECGIEAKFAKFIDDFVDRHGVRALLCLIRFANWLAVQHLLVLACAKFATFIHGKSADKMAEALKAVNESRQSDGKRSRAR